MCINWAKKYFWIQSGWMRRWERRGSGFKKVKSFVRDPHVNGRT